MSAAAKFQVGDVVAFQRGAGDSNLPAGDFTILRVMPSEAGQRTYRVRGKKDGQERVLPEDQMTATSGVFGGR
jgi:hypothetical protein